MSEIAVQLEEAKRKAREKMEREQEAYKKKRQMERGEAPRQRIKTTTRKELYDPNDVTKRGHVASRAERKQQAKVLLEKKRLELAQERQTKKFIAGKTDQKEYVDKTKPNFWLRMAEETMVMQLKHMGDTEKNIIKFQKKRVRRSAIIFLIGLIAGIIVQPLIIAGAAVMALFLYKFEAKRVNSFYGGWKFERQLNFSKFTRLIIPYLKSSKGNSALYTIFNKIIKRLDKETDKKNLYTLMGEMGDRPTDLQPFLDFAERSSGTDMSYLFMSTIFDFQQSTFDTSVIDELGKMASDDMMVAIDEIIAFKLKRFVMFPTKVVMSSFILVAGLGVALMLHNFKNIGFSTDMIAPPGMSESGDLTGVDPIGGETPVETPENEEGAIPIEPEEPAPEVQEPTPEEIAEERFGEDEDEPETVSEKIIGQSTMDFKTLTDEAPSVKEGMTWATIDIEANAHMIWYAISYASYHMEPGTVHAVVNRSDDTVSVLVDLGTDIFVTVYAYDDTKPYTEQSFESGEILQKYRIDPSSTNIIELAE